MPFEVKDLVTLLDLSVDKRWMLMIGCGARSSICDNTQLPTIPTRPAFRRGEPIDLETGVKTRDDLHALRFELQRQLDSVNARLAIPEDDEERRRMLDGKNDQQQEEQETASSRPSVAPEKS